MNVMNALNVMVTGLLAGAMAAASVGSAGAQGETTSLQPGNKGDQLQHTMKHPNKATDDDAKGNGNSSDKDNADGRKQLLVTVRDGLGFAIKEATQLLEDPTVKEVTIVIGTTLDQTLPPEINAKGKITIVGFGDKPAGVNYDGTVMRTPLIPSTPFHGTTVKSPLEIRGIGMTFDGVLFKTSSSITIKNSMIKRNNTSTEPHVALIEPAFEPDTSKQHKIEIEDSDIQLTAITKGDLGEAELDIKKNRIVMNETTNGPIIAVGGAGKNPASTEIKDNMFSGTAVKADAPIVVISRPNVDVEGNVFNLVHSPDNVPVIAIVNDPDRSAPLASIEIDQNAFIGGQAVVNPAGKPLGKDTIRIEKNDLSDAKGVLPIGPDAPAGLVTVSPAEAFAAGQNYWGKLDLTKVGARTEPILKDAKDAGPTKVKKPQPPSTTPAPKPPTGPTAPPAPGAPAPGIPSPGEPSTQPGSIAKPVHRYSGETRFETAVAISKARTKDDDHPKMIILARGDVAADSVSGVPLADEYDAPILLTQPDTLHPATAAEIQRILPKGGKVIIMGGEAAISKQVEAEVKTLGAQIERIAGVNRAATAVETANWLKNAGKLKHLLVADGTDWQPDLIAGPVAAEVTGATLLTNGTTMAPETEAFMAAHRALPVTAIGSVAKRAAKVPDAVEAEGGEALSLAVAKRFFKEPKAVGVATTGDFADALAGGAHIADEDGPMLLIGNRLPADMQTWINTGNSIKQVMIYGGQARIPDLARKTDNQ